MTSSTAPPGADTVAGSPQRFTIKVPGSTSNLGPGFDVLGLALSIWLTLDVQVDESDPDASEAPVLSYTGEGAVAVPLTWEKNLITTTAAYVLSSLRPATSSDPLFPRGTTIRVSNAIPLGRGLGSSGAAVVAGVVLANEVGGLGLSLERMLDYCLAIEHHPDNVTAALVGGFVASYQGATSCAVDSFVALHRPPPTSMVRHIRLGWSPQLKAVAVVPHFEVSTSVARDALPETYPLADVVFNLQRLAVLTAALGRSPPDTETIYHAMTDRIHQPHRMRLVPGLDEILRDVKPKLVPGCVGLCLSGAGPTVLALATSDFEGVGEAIRLVFRKHGVDSDVRVLDVVEHGATVSRK